MIFTGGSKTRKRMKLNVLILIEPCMRFKAYMFRACISIHQPRVTIQFSCLKSCLEASSEFDKII